MIMYAAAMGNTITAVFQCLSAISVNGFLTLFLRWFLLVAFLYLTQMKQFLDGILHIYDEGRTAVKMGDLFGIVTAAEERVAEKEKFRGSLTSENDD